ncbi:CDF-like metal transporter [Mucidula mucida]|nr:CDF-like metal transporter [Mucidula mucida]
MNEFEPKTTEPSAAAAGPVGARCFWRWGTETQTPNAEPASDREQPKDVERAESLVSSTTTQASDPFELRNGVKTEGELTELRRRRGGNQVARYQSKQNELIKYLLKPLDEHATEAKDEEDAARLFVKLAVWASLISNVALCVLQMYAAISSLSLSLLATGIDSVFDIGSNILLFWLHRKSSHMDARRWPVGGARLETIGNIVYGFLMGSVNMIVAVESIRSIISKKNDDLSEFHLPSIIAVSAALGIKFLLFLFSYPFRKHSSQVEVLWEDHRNDLWINGFGILMSTGGSKWKWYLDPLGAVLIALGIIASWTRTVYIQFGLLAGKAAPHDFLQLLVYKAMTFSDEIEKVDTVRAYHSGPDYFVEIDIVMDASTPLWKAHDVSQQLQDKLEMLPSVERAFVHVDHETVHVPEHRKLQ